MKASSRVIKAVIFDIDGTLIDSVDLHVECWLEALAHFGYQADRATIRGLIGKAAGPLMDAVVPRETPAERKEALDQFRSDLFKREYRDRIKPFPGVRALFERIRRDGRKTALASSCKREELTHYKNVAEISDLVDAETTADDVQRSKPAPEVLQRCLAKLAGVGAAAAVMVGDSRFDMEAAVRAGMAAVGLRCGGGTEEELRRAGAAAIYSDPHDLLAHYDDVLGEVAAPALRMPSALQG